MLKSIGINKVYYSIENNIVCEKVSHMISINSSNMWKVVDQIHYNAPVNVIDYYKNIIQKMPQSIKKINAEFDRFFKLMFGGGEARLEIIKEVKKKRKKLDEDLETEMQEEEEVSEGIDIHVALPHKKTKGLMMLSGGERALTSIALLFAMSQVNPPPFIILDETDAALDEANSRKYGDMIEALSKHSQLILITHNRETMSRAGVIYGVTMAGEGHSKLLSIAFDEAVVVAK
jgi:chromosome segregation protein